MKEPKSQQRGWAPGWTEGWQSKSYVESRRSASVRGESSVDEEPCRNEADVGVG